ncbi:MAG TPA: DUF72 domain-containing protein [Flavobacteriales bacterium]
MSGRSFIGTAGWQLPKPVRARTDRNGSQLERYADLFRAVEVNSTFYRLPRATTVERWAASVPKDFRFAVKLPKGISHASSQAAITPLLHEFRVILEAFGKKLGPILVQLPPKQAFDERMEELLQLLHENGLGSIVVEPRHRSWAAPEAEALLKRLRMSRVAADPARFERDALPGGDQRLVYFRLHGSPRIYWSPYDEERLAQWRDRIHATKAKETWVVFDNTATGAAAENALRMQELLQR